MFFLIQKLSTALTSIMNLKNMTVLNSGHEVGRIGIGTLTI